MRAVRDDVGMVLGCVMSTGARKLIRINGPLVKVAFALIRVCERIPDMYHIM